ncbi:hypothetical protein LAUMK191_05684 [Mycobacterium attenuatum]|nr:hypothetical protein LAUMK191_05684 [Mycobacterium attenuatum]
MLVLTACRVRIASIASPGATRTNHCCSSIKTSVVSACTRDKRSTPRPSGMAWRVTSSLSGVDSGSAHTTRLLRARSTLARSGCVWSGPKRAARCGWSLPTNAHVGESSAARELSRGRIGQVSSSKPCRSPTVLGVSSAGTSGRARRVIAWMVMTGAPVGSVACSLKVSVPVGMSWMCKLVAVVACRWIPLRTNGSCRVFSVSVAAKNTA